MAHTVLAWHLPNARNAHGNQWARWLYLRLGYIGMPLSTYARANGRNTYIRATYTHNRLTVACHLAREGFAHTMAKGTNNNTGTPITPERVGRAGSTMFIVPTLDGTGHALAFAQAATLRNGGTVSDLNTLAVRLAAVTFGIRGRMANATGAIVAADVRYMRTHPSEKWGVWHEFRRNANGIACLGHGDGVCNAKSTREGYRVDGALTMRAELATADSIATNAQRNFATLVNALRALKCSDADIVATPHVAQLLAAGLSMPSASRSTASKATAPRTRTRKVATAVVAPDNADTGDNAEID